MSEPVKEQCKARNISKVKKRWSYTYLLRQMTSEGGIPVDDAACDVLDLCLGAELDDAGDACAVIAGADA
jgi:hypothetical protein